MSYAVKEIYFTLQGEGRQTGRAAVFLRFSGCNLWSGREQHRSAAVCRFCDTDFVGTDGVLGGSYPGPKDVTEAVLSCWGDRPMANALVVCTGGEPLLQLDEDLVVALHEAGFSVAVETNGTLPAPPGIDWICVSPKGAASLKLVRGNELKLVFPQSEPEAQPAEFESLDFEHFFLQPLDSADLEQNTRLTIEYCSRNPRWQLSLQVHKLIGMD